MHPFATPWKQKTLRFFWNNFTFAAVLEKVRIEYMNASPSKTRC